MKRYSLRTIIAVRFALIVLFAVFLISIVSNVLINRQFESYMEEQQNTKAREMAKNLSNQYDGSAEEGWDLDYIHGFGMYALNEGYIIKLYDEKEQILWDAENHDMTLCHQMMDKIELQMKEKKPEVEGKFVIHRFPLEQNQETVGFLDVSYYTPYNLDENDFQFITKLNHILLVVGVISLAGAIFMGLIFAGTITEPIAKTVEITKQISAGDYTIRFKGGVKTRELRELVKALNQMAASLEEQEALRKRLTSDVAHELRTPLANVSSYLEAILEGVWEPTPERLKSCYDELDRISTLVSDLEQLRQVEDENLKLNKTEVDLYDLAEVVVRNFETQTSQKGLRCTVEGSHAVVCADRGRIQQVLINLISNAVKYSVENGKIQIQIKETEETAVISVEDEGIGIAKEDQKRIFERFYRTDLSRNRKTGGAGIGLAIVKTIVKAHGGEIQLSSKEGSGSKFVITLPKNFS